MLSGKESISHYTRANITIWMLLAFQAGFLNTGGFMACHRFVSHVTGFATFMGLEVSEGRYEQALGMLLVPLFFLIGAMLSGFFVDIRVKLHRKPLYYIPFGIMFVLLVVSLVGGVRGQFGAFGEAYTQHKDLPLLIMLCMICGLQNGLVTTVSRSIVRTTHLTGITTDLGLGVIRVMYRDQLPSELSDELRANLMRVGIILCFGLGAVSGGFLFFDLGYAGFFLPTVISGGFFLVTLYFQELKARWVAGTSL